MYARACTNYILNNIYPLYSHEKKSIHTPTNSLKVTVDQLTF